MNSPSQDLFIFVVCSASGAGKSTLIRHLLSEMPELTFSISHTTRPPRKGEEDGVDYYFVDQERFESMRDAERFSEHAEVHGNLYGSSVDEFERAVAENKAGIVMDIDHQGARQCLARFPEAKGVFVLPPSLGELRRRLEHRALDDAATIDRRVAKARSEIERYPFFDYLLVNDDLTTAKKGIVAIARAELCKRERLAHLAERILDNEEL